MSDVVEKTSDETPESPLAQNISMNIYLLWRSAEHDKFVIQALFNPEAKFSLELVARLSDDTQQDQNPCIYRLQLNLMKDANNQLTIKHQKTIYSAKQYQLRISQKKHFYTSHFEENDHRIIKNTDDSHEFLFDVLFRTSPPGTFVRKIKLFQLIL